MGQGLETLRKSRVRVIGKKSSPTNLVKFLDALASVGVMAEACRQAGFCRTTAKYYMQQAREGVPGLANVKWGNIEGPFDELVQIAIANAIEEVEVCMFKRARGYDEPQTYQGRVQFEIDHDAIALGAEPGTWEAILKDKNGKPIPVTIMRQSEDLMMFLAKKHKPDIYGDKTQLDVIHRGGVMIVTAPARSSSELEQQAKKMAAEAVEVEFVEIEDEPDPLS